MLANLKGRIGERVEVLRFISTDIYQFVSCNSTSALFTFQRPLILLLKTKFKLSWVKISVLATISLCALFRFDATWNEERM